MKILIALLVIGFSLNTFAAEKKLATDLLETGCGWSDLVYTIIKYKVSEKSKVNIPFRPEGKESGRRFYAYEDKSWFFTIEFFSDAGTDRDITCIMAVGDGIKPYNVVNYTYTELPKWKWGNPAGPN